jgi:sugar phosphate isomerase/epimerase
MRQSLPRRIKLKQNYFGHTALLSRSAAYRFWCQTDMHFLTRRTFIEKLSTIAAGNLIASSARNTFASVGAVPHISFPTAPRDRVAIASYPFRAYIDSPGNRDRNPSLPGMDLLQFPAEVAKKFGVRNIEPYSRHFSSLDSAYLAKFREALDKANAKAVNIAVSVQESFYDEDPAPRSKAIASARKWVDVAVSIGSPGIRAHIHTAPNSPPSLERTVASLREVVRYSAGKNIVVTLENDDLVSEDAFFLVKVIESVNHPYLRALPDFANSMLTGDADFNYRALQAMFQHAYCICHVKDGEADDHGKQFNIDLEKSFQTLKASGYQGYCSMEFDAPGDPYAATTKLVDQTIRYLS